MDNAGLALGRPPVRRVRLALYFGIEGEVSAIDVDGIRAIWKSTYPYVTQLPPLPPEDPASGFPDFASKWPLPFTVFEGDGDGRRISFQGDRFAVEWEFTNDAVKYPGYDDLRDELKARFTDFQNRIAENGNNSALTCVRAEALYVNELGTHGTLGLLKSPLVIASPGAAYNTYTRHYHWGSEAAGWVTYADDPDGGVELRIRQQAEMGENFVDHWAMLDECHEQVIRAFTDWTTEEMREEWR